jgi:peptide-methionine (S)-S-oxide reductase
MTSRSLAAFLLIALVLGLAGAGRSQEAAVPAKKDGHGKKAPATAKPAAVKTENEPASAQPKSPGDSAEKPSAPKKAKLESATFGAGCFWHVEAVFDRLKGVKTAISGYAGGNVRFPSYEMVHEGITGHAEVVRVVYDPEVLSYEDLLKVFWSCHDPTTLNRQGEDVGTQYRSIILYHNEDQRRAALKSYRELTAAGVFRDPIVTQLVPLRAFYRAEDYHQDYYGGKPRAGAHRRKTVNSKGGKAHAKAPKASRNAKQTGAPLDAPEEADGP